MSPSPPAPKATIQPEQGNSVNSHPQPPDPETARPCPDLSRHALTTQLHLVLAADFAEIIYGPGPGLPLVHPAQLCPSLP